MFSKTYSQVRRGENSQSANTSATCPWTHIRGNDGENSSASNPWVGKYNRRQRAREDEFLAIDFDAD